jgi:hypothetical protein
LAQELVGYPVVAGSPYLRRGISPSWAKLTLVVRDERVHTPEEPRFDQNEKSRSVDRMRCRHVQRAFHSPCAAIPNG